MAKQAANSPTSAAEIFMPLQEKKSCILADIMINLFLFVDLVFRRIFCSRQNIDSGTAEEQAVSQVEKYDLSGENRTWESGALNVGLLDLIAGQMGCDFLSDLRFLNSTQRAELAQKLEKLSADAFGLHDWNDALEYMAGQPSEQSAAEAREALLRCLKNEENKK